MRWFLLGAVLLVAAAVAGSFLYVTRGSGSEPVALPQDPMPGRLLVGFQDDASLRWAPERAELLDSVRDARAAVIRTILVWEAAAPERPSNPENPFDAAYRLDDLDDLARSAQQRGVELLVTIWGTPSWANGDAGPNHPPSDPQELESFAYALAERYSGRHPGYPAVRLFSAWNEPNLEQFLAPQFDAAGRSVSPALYAPLAGAVYDGVKRANPEALVAIGETSPRGHDVPSRGRVQDSHSPARFARLLSEESPDIEFDAWAQHPYPPRPLVAPSDPVRWPRVGLANLERLGNSLDEWFGQDETPIWVTEYGHETHPDALGISPELQARFLGEALTLVAGNPRVRMFVWFIVRDRPGNPWQSGLIAADGSPKPGLTTYGDAAARLDARHPVLPDGATIVRVPALELAYHTPVGAPIDVSVEGANEQVPLGQDGWLAVPLDERLPAAFTVAASDRSGHSIERQVQLETSDLELE